MILSVRAVLSWVVLGSGMHALAQATAAGPLQPVVPSRELVRRVFVQRDPKWSCGQQVGVQYVARVRVAVDEAGKPSGAQIEDSSGRECLDEMAVAAVNEAAFRAATNEDGKPIASTIVVPVNFPFHPLPTPEQIAARPRFLFTPEVSTGNCRLKVTTNVEIKMTIQVDGTPANVELVTPSGDACLDRQAVKLGEQYRFKPAMKDGQPVVTPIYVEVNFQKF